MVVVDVPSNRGLHGNPFFFFFFFWYTHLFWVCIDRERETIKEEEYKEKKKREEINGRKEELHRGMRNAGLCI